MYSLFKFFCYCYWVCGKFFLHLWTFGISLLLVSFKCILNCGIADLSWYRGFCYFLLPFSLSFHSFCFLFLLFFLLLFPLIPGKPLNLLPLNFCPTGGQCDSVLRHEAGAPSSGFHCSKATCKLHPRKRLQWFFHIISATDYATLPLVSSSEPGSGPHLIEKCLQSNCPI